MPVTAGPEISFSDLDTEFGDGGEIPLSDYYKGGGLVPSYVQEGEYFSSSAPEYQVINYISPNNNQFDWNGTTLYYGAATSYYDGSQWTYYIGTFQFLATYYYYAIYRQDLINDSVPASGEVSLSDFYGATA